MPYTPQSWTDGPGGGTPLSAARMNIIEAGIQAAQAAAEAAVAKALADAKGDLLIGTGPDAVGKHTVGAPDTVLQTDAATATGVKWEKIGNAQIASTAAIAASKLAGYPADNTKVLLGDGTWGTLAGMPSGVVLAFGGLVASIPTGWLHCDGSAISRATFAALFTALSTRYGAGDGSTTFNIPDFRGRSIFGLGSHADVNAHGDTDGVAEANRTPKHNSSVTDPGHIHTEDEPGGSTAGNPGGGILAGSQGGSTGSATTGITVGPGGTRPIDTPAYGVAVWIIKT